MPINPVSRGGWGGLTADGLTKREYFTGLAMQAMITKFGNACDRNVKEAVEIADELLKELEK